MNDWQARVAEFHAATQQKNTLDTPEARELRAKLIMEEAVETVSALGFTAMATIEDSHRPDPEHHQDALVIGHFSRRYEKPEPLDFIDGLCDLIYVSLGGAENMRVDLDPHFTEVHRANMAKLSGPKREDGKQLKPEGWEPPDHASVLEESFLVRTVPLADWDTP